MRSQDLIEPALVDTPVLVVDLDKVAINLRDMASFAKNNGLLLRPHCKTHKTPALARMQIEYGAAGITASKIGEAEAMADAGIKDIRIAYPIVGDVKIRRYLQLAQRVNLSCIIDNLEAAAQLGRAAAIAGTVAHVLVKIDVGLNRCGVPPGQDAVSFTRQALELGGLQILGILSHAGHAYSAPTYAQVEDIGRNEGQVMVATAHMLHEAGIPIREVSVGSTPTAKSAGSVPGVTEIRPGNYIFYDAMQVALGLVEPERCALSVLTQVCSTPSDDRAIIDAGSKTLGLDLGVHGISTLHGHGIIVGRPDLTIVRLSEEHGIIRIPPDGSRVCLGDIIRVIPNHACTVVNNFGELVATRDWKVQAVWPVTARGKNK